MTGHRAGDLAASGLWARALGREAGRVRGWLEAGEWRPGGADRAAVGAVLGRLAAPLPALRLRPGRRTGRTDRRPRRVRRCFPS
ncbi:hypothetical protein ADL22_27125 [Streptomyces sp. NRRL F-4489]|nr:hypothetical protein ADL22_27125 [Streptomyces sp. NRRL F-4489]